MRRRLLAREQGHVARSADLTASAGLLAASALLYGFGDDLASGLLELVRAPWLGDLGVGTLVDASGLLDRVRGAVVGVAWPLAAILGGSAFAAFAAHQAQVGGLFLPHLLAPDFGRVWHVSLDEDGGGEGLGGRAARGAWSILKGATVLAVAMVLIRSELGPIGRLGWLSTAELAASGGSILRSAALLMALTLAALGGVDYALQRRRFEALMKMTSDEHREDQRSADGDPAIRSRRRQLAKALRGDSPELLAGSTLALLGPLDLVLVLAGGPPPRRVSVRISAHGAAGKALRRSVEKANIPTLESPKLAASIARARATLVPGELLEPLRAAWPEVE